MSKEKEINNHSETNKEKINKKDEKSKSKMKKGLINKVKSIKGKKYFVGLLIVLFFSTIVYLNSFIPRYKSASFDFLKEGIYNNCINTLVYQKKIDPLTAQIECEKFVNTQGEQIIKSYEDFYTGPEGRYLTGIDPYYYYRLTKNMLTKGHYYEELKSYDINADGKMEKVPYDNLQYAPPGHPMGKVPFWSVFEYYSFKIWSSIFTNWKDKLMGFLYWLPVFLAPIASIFAYLIGRRLFNDWVGLFFGIMMVFNSTFLSRSFAGFADTDSLNVVLPLISLFFFILSFYSKNIILKSIYGVISAFVLAIFAWHWQGWWYALWIVIAWLGFKGLEYLYFYWKEKRKINLEFIKEFFKLKQVRELITFSLAYLITTAVFVSFILGPMAFINAFIAPIKILIHYDSTFNGYWPNTLLTVAEAADTGSLKAVLNKVFDFGAVNFKFFAWLGFFGAFYFAYEAIKRRRWELLAFIFWLAAAIAYSMQGVRFLMYLGVPLAFFSAYTLYRLLEYVILRFNFDELFKKTLKLTVFSITTLILLALSSKTYNLLHAIGEFNDNWYNTMKFIKDNDFKVITSWWDFGHYFIAMTKKMTTFDGATQTTPRAFWVGKALQSPENLSKQIITDLATNGDDFFNSIITYLSALELGYSKEEALKIAKERIKDEKMNVLLYFQKHYKNWSKLYYGTFNSTAIGVNILLQILPLNRSEAYKKLIEGVYLKEINKTFKFDKEFADFLINLTHPLHPNKVAFITSEDMVGKSGAWGALGNWDFFNPPKTKEEFYSRGKFYLTYKFNKLNNLYFALFPKDLNGDGIISKGEGIYFIYKNNSIYVDKQKIRAYIFNQTSLILENGTDIMPEIDILVIVNKNKPEQMVLMNRGMINALFTRMWFMNGYGLKYFKKVYVNKNNPRIIVWSLN